MLFKKVIFFFSCLYYLGSNNYAQNLVPNPGFELMNNCTITMWDYPIDGDILDWYTYDLSNSTVDILHTCFTLAQFQPPNTIRGYSFPHNGNGMAGIACTKQDDVRETASVALTSTLIKDSAYCVSFWIKNSRIENVYYWIEQIGLLFTKDTITYSVVRNSNPHVRSIGVLNKNEWIEISGYYIAQGGEKFANIGFFGSAVNMSHNKPFSFGYGPYYFIDDVSVTMCNKDSLLSVVCELPNVFTANKDNTNDSYSLKLNNIKKIDIQVLNRWGNVVREYDGVLEEWNGEDNQGDPLTEGVYFIKAIAETTFGEIFSKYQYVHLIR